MTFRSVIFAILVFLPWASHAFVQRRFPSPSSVGVTTLAASVMSGEDMGSSTIAKDKYDIVKVDLDDGRDYPIYIGTGYSDEEGKSGRAPCRRPLHCFHRPSNIMIVKYRVLSCAARPVQPQNYCSHM